MGFTDGRIELIQNNGKYYPGQTLIGKVIFDEGKVKTIRGIYVVIKGYCNVYWSEYQGRGHTDVYESYEEYIHLKMYLIGGDSGKITIAPGHYEFPFQFMLPDNLPSSFEGTVGHVRYDLKVVVDRPFKFNQELAGPLTVLPYIDLNMNPLAKSPLEFQMEDIYCCWCVSSGSSEVLVTMPSRGFCVGQPIPMEISCANNSSVKIKRIRLAIKTNTTYIAKSLDGTKLNSEKLLEVIKGPVPAHSSRNWTFTMTLPDMTLYNLNICRFINIEHIFKVTVESSGCHVNDKQTQNIFIGNVPLRDLGRDN